jgi:hypothetical protein
MHRFNRTRTPSLSPLRKEDVEDEYISDSESDSDDDEDPVVKPKPVVAGGMLRFPWSSWLHDRTKGWLPQRATATKPTSPWLQAQQQQQQQQQQQPTWLQKPSTWSWRRATWKVVRLYMFVVIVHYICANLYSRWCTPQSIYGLVMSPLMVPAPHCEGLRWVVYHGAVRINGMWLLMGGQVVDFVTHIFM